MNRANGVTAEEQVELALTEGRIAELNDHTARVTKVHLRSKLAVLALSMDSLTFGVASAMLYEARGDLRALEHAGHDVEAIRRVWCGLWLAQTMDARLEPVWAEAAPVG